MAYAHAQFKQRTCAIQACSSNGPAPSVVLVLVYIMTPSVGLVLDRGHTHLPTFGPTCAHERKPHESHADGTRITKNTNPGPAMDRRHDIVHVHVGNVHPRWATYPWTCPGHGVSTRHMQYKEAGLSNCKCESRCGSVNHTQFKFRQLHELQGTSNPNWRHTYDSARPSGAG